MGQSAPLIWRSGSCLALVKILFAMSAAGCSSPEDDSSALASVPCESSPHPGDPCAPALDGHACSVICSNSDMDRFEGQCIGGRWQGTTGSCDVPPCSTNDCGVGAHDAFDAGPCLVDPGEGRWSCEGSMRALTYQVVLCGDPACGCGARSCSGACDKVTGEVSCASGEHCVLDEPFDGSNRYDGPCQPDMIDGGDADTEN